MSLAITAADLSKRYRLGQRAPYGALRDSLSRLWSRPQPDLPAGAGRAVDRWIWALEGVTFDVAEGDVVGVIGRNGSGKSTLLKVLSRITEPTRGSATVRGRVGSLLEVGTGFHPELTGRENVFVNGAILGMRRREIAAKFDEIVTFSGVDLFIDTPVKFYSSGMQMRLAFAVAAHLEPHILLVDEVLAVGDLEFQRKCLGKMDDVSRDGRTVLFVSHQMNQIRRLCRTVMWLDRGKVRAFGATGMVLGQYEAAVLRGEAGGAGRCFTGWELSTGGHVLHDGLNPVTLRVSVDLDEAVSGGHLGVGLTDDRDAVVAGWAFEPVTIASGRHVLDVTIASLPLRPASYHLNLALFDQGNNLNGGRLVEKWVAAPPLILDVEPLGHPQDDWAGVLNVPATLREHPGAAGTTSAAHPGRPRSAVGAS